jgi:Flp pilus assembly protein TadD
VLILSRAVERFPDEPKVYAALGGVWLDAAEARDDVVALRKAIEALSTAAGHSNATSAALTDLGRALLMRGDPTAAERSLRQAIDRLPVEPEAFLHLAVASRRAGKIQEARDSLVKYVTLVGDDVVLAPLAAQIASDSLRIGDPHLALRWIDRAVDDAGETPALASLRRRALAALASTTAAR